MYAHIPSHTLPGGGPVPPPPPPCDSRETRSSNSRLNMDIFELTVPLETNIKNANAQKMKKYKHFITDITTLLKSAQEDISHHQIKQI